MENQGFTCRKERILIARQMEVQLIQSRQNQRVVRLEELRKDRRARDEAKLFVIEGIRELERAADSGVALRELYFTRSFMRSVAAERVLAKISALPGIEIFELSEDAMTRASYREYPEGLIAIAAIQSHNLADLSATLAATKRTGGNKPALFLVAESVEKPGNLGALLRTADSAGCDALICCDAVCEPYNPNAIRASQGALFSLPFAIAESGEAAAWLRGRGVKIFATTPAADKICWDCDFRSDTAIVLGSEATGLSPFWLGAEGAAEKIAIPQLGISDSLNVSIAAAICLFEVVRQRTKQA